MKNPFFKLTDINNTKFNKKLNDIRDKLENFFGIKIMPPWIFLIEPSQLNILYQKKKEKTILGNSHNNVIFVMAKLIDKDPEKFWKILTHEYTHVVMRNFCKTSSIYPLWLREGLPSFLSGQEQVFSNKNKNKYLKYYYDHTDQYIYAFGYNMVKELIEKFGKKKLLKLLQNTKQMNTYQNFKEIFKNIYDNI